MRQKPAAVISICMIWQLCVMAVAASGTESDQDIPDHTKQPAILSTRSESIEFWILNLLIKIPIQMEYVQRGWRSWDEWNRISIKIVNLSDCIDLQFHVNVKLIFISMENVLLIGNRHKHAARPRHYHRQSPHVTRFFLITLYSVHLGKGDNRTCMMYGWLGE